MKKHLVLKVLLGLLPALVFTQDWAWMTGNKIIGIAFLVLWLLMIWYVSKLQDKNKIIHDLLRATEIGFFLLPISALVLTFVIGSKVIDSSQSGAEQAGAAIGTAIGGAFAVGIGFVVGLFGGIILHLIANRYGKKIAEDADVTEGQKLNWFDKHKGWTAVLAIVLLAIIASATGGNKEIANNSNTQPAANNSQSAAQQEPAKPQEPSPLEIVNTSVSEDSIGTPVANVTVRNTSAKEMDGVKLLIKTFNNFGEPANGFLTDNNYKGISQEKIAPGKTTTLSWPLYNYDTASKIEASVYQIHFSDGTTWGEDMP